MTGNSEGPFFATDIDNGTSELVSPPMDLSNYNEPMIRFYWWMVDVTNQGQPGDDTLRVVISGPLGEETLFEIDSTFSNSWSLVDSFPINNHAALGNPLTIRFTIGDEGEQGHAKPRAL